MCIRDCLHIIDPGPLCAIFAFGAYYIRKTRGDIYSKEIVFSLVNTQLKIEEEEESYYIVLPIFLE